MSPTDSTSNRTLDQQCTVTRPGCAPLASAFAVELLVALLHHPLRGRAPAEGATAVTERTSTILGLVPHQVRGFLPHFTQLLLQAPAFEQCPACSPTVLAAYEAGGACLYLDRTPQP